MVLGLNNSIIWNKKISEFDPNTVVDPTYIYGTTSNQTGLIAWYDFTDQSSVYKNIEAAISISENENIGRIENKLFPGMGAFLRAITSGTGTFGAAGDEAPVWKTDGANGHSYAEFDSTGFSGGGQCLVGSDYYDLSDKGHGGGVGSGGSGSSFPWLNGFLYLFFSNGASSPNDNRFCMQEVDNHNFTVIWVVEPSATTYGGSGEQTHWLIRPDDASDSGTGRDAETYFEAKFDANDDKLKITLNCEDQNSGSGTKYSTSTGIPAVSGPLILIAEFKSGSNKMQIRNMTTGQNDTTTITTNSTYNMTSGMMSLGRWSLGNVNSGHTADSGFDGKFYEIMMWNTLLTDDQHTQVHDHLYYKYN